MLVPECLRAPLFGLALAACGGASLAASAPTTTRPDAGWLRVDARSMGLSFAVPADRPADVEPRADPHAVGVCMDAARGREPPARDAHEEPNPRYTRSVCVRADGQTYLVAVVVALDEQDLNMFGHSIGHSVKKAERTAQFSLGAYEGAEWTRKNEDGTVESSRAWIAKDRFYFVSTMAKSDRAAFEADARRFLDSLVMIDAP